VTVKVTRAALVGLVGLTVRVIPVSPINSKPLDLVWGRAALVFLAAMTAKDLPTVVQQWSLSMVRL
jgi:hypothetical protein